jgi:hypothetical protein
MVPISGTFMAEFVLVRQPAETGFVRRLIVVEGDLSRG